ncbi:MAG: hypothetical protein J5600_06770 [Desulfovibrio sp.]|nr:hypothetical protein [Desulfovibrio sp.]MBR5051019.1 hypothetical protein [Desulfovibrio sp.]
MLHSLKSLPLACACLLAAAGFAPSQSLAQAADFGKLLAEKQELTFLFCAGQGDTLDAACAEPDEGATMVCKNDTCEQDWEVESMRYTWSKKDGGIELVNVTVVNVDYKGRTIAVRDGERSVLYANDQPGRTFPADFGKVFEQTPNVSWYACDGNDEGTDCKALDKSRSYAFAKDGTGRATDHADKDEGFIWKPRQGGAEATFTRREQYRFDGRRLVMPTAPDGPRVAWVLKQAR